MTSPASNLPNMAVLDAAELHRRIAALDAERNRLCRELDGPDCDNEASQRTPLALTAQLRQVTEELAITRTALRDSAGWHRLICESATDYAIITTDVTGRITTWNIGAQNLFGWREEEAIGQALSTIFVPEDCAANIPETEMQKARVSGRANDERWHRRKDNSRFWASGLLMPLRDNDDVLGYLKIIRDQTSRRQAEEAMRKALAENNLLMREMHHRVKNSLQLVHSLLVLQARAAGKSELETQLAESAARVQTIAAIHDRLYRSDSVLRIEIGSYLSGLIEDLKAGMASTLDGRDITLDADHLVWPASEVPPVGLILTELVTNALKYGAGRIRVTFRASAQGAVVLSVEDKGQALPKDFMPEKSRGLGMRVVIGLLRPRGGRLEIDRSGGATRFIAYLPEPREERGE